MRIDRRRKMPVTTLLLALVLEQDDADAPEPRRDDLAALGLTENDVRPLEHDAEAKRRTYALLPEGVLKLFYDHVNLRAQRPGLEAAVPAGAPARPEAHRRSGRRRERRRSAEAGTKLTPRLLKRLEEQGLRERLRVLGGAGRALCRDRSDRPEDRPGLRRGRRRADAGAAREAGPGRDRRAAGARHRPRHGRAVHAQHACRRPLDLARGCAARHLPRAAPGRAAHSGHRGDPVPRPVLRLRALRPVAGRPGQDEPASASRPRIRCACCARST